MAKPSAASVAAASPGAPSVPAMAQVCIGLDAEGQPVRRPALVTAVHSDTCVNVQVFLDGSNDDRFGKLPGQVTRHGWLVWCTSLTAGEGVGQWSR